MKTIFALLLCVIIAGCGLFGDKKIIFGDGLETNDEMAVDTVAIK